MSEITKLIIEAVFNKQPIQIKDSFGVEISSRVKSLIEAKKVEMGPLMFQDDEDDDEDDETDMSVNVNKGASIGEDSIEFLNKHKKGIGLGLAAVGAAHLAKKHQKLVGDALAAYGAVHAAKRFKQLKKQERGSMDEGLQELYDELEYLKEQTNGKYDINEETLSMIYEYFNTDESFDANNPEHRDKLKRLIGSIHSMNKGNKHAKFATDALKHILKKKA